jgi:hypothetical protein
MENALIQYYSPYTCEQTCPLPDDPAYKCLNAFGMSLPAPAVNLTAGICSDNPYHKLVGCGKKVFNMLDWLDHLHHKCENVLFSCPLCKKPITRIAMAAHLSNSCKKSELFRFE